ncbi:hypothetical protein [Variovorax sp. N23]|uniref:hypothetical protein n=1 Tax=Variovorax sp. N23 TaxID=2980555 RepID=UPI0021CA7927|nr:hypothetical protein [Variovorax sp. N23]MCU4119358.1 hypothetical protein [Variovorax sp. N23]
MIDVCYVISWRYSDGSASGTVCVHHDKARSEAVLRILEEQGEARRFRIEAVPFDPAHAAPAAASTKESA